MSEDRVINTYDELFNYLRVLYATRRTPDYIEFRGTKCKVEGTMPDPKGIFIPVLNGYVFLLSNPVDYDEDHCYLWVFHGPFVLDQTLCVELPSSVKADLELIFYKIL